MNYSPEHVMCECQNPCSRVAIGNQILFCFVHVIIQFLIPQSLVLFVNGHEFANTSSGQSAHLVVCCFRNGCELSSLNFLT
jgi:hypothetical protein